MDILLTNAISILKTLVAFDTTSRNSNRQLIDYVVGYLGAEGIASTLIFNADGGKANLLATIGEGKKDGIIFSGHTDVVPVDGQNWQSPPFALTEREGKLYGRGAADMKGFVAVILAMVPEWTQSPLKRPVHLALSYDEEVGCLGAHSLVEGLLKQGIRPAMAIIGEPTEMQVINNHKGIYSYRTTITGHEAHSSAVDKGVSAIMVAAELIQFLNGLQQEYKLLQEPLFDPPYTTFHIGTIEGGTAQNIIPGKCVFEWEFRIIPGQDEKKIFGQFEDKCRELVVEMQRIAKTASIVTEMTSYVPALLATNREAEQLLLSASGANNAESVSFGTEAGIFQQAGIPAFICGPGSIMQAHKPDEFVEIAQLEMALTFITQIMQRFLASS